MTKTIMLTKKIMNWVAMATMAGTLATGCATASVTTKTASAPITYKVGQGNAAYASLDYDKRTIRPKAPRSFDPVGGQGHDFDPGQIDRSLYSHMKVGQRYTVMGQTFTPKHDPEYDEVGTASWYGPKFHGKPTANGETFDRYALTAAHPTLALNSLVRVTNLENGKAITVRLNDRGPFVGGRMIDMSEAGAKALGFKIQGKAKVRVRYLGPADPSAGHRVLQRQAPRVAELPRENLAPAPRQTIPALPQYTPRQTHPQSQPAPLYAEPAPAPVLPTQPRRTPQADLPSDGTVTMTIKGPIHIARSTDQEAKPHFIAKPAKTR